VIKTIPAGLDSGPSSKLIEMGMGRFFINMIRNISDCVTIYYISIVKLRIAEKVGAKNLMAQIVVIGRM